ncbi:MAG: response regulator transcription factor [Oligoflexales bacterium]
MTMEGDPEYIIVLDDDPMIEKIIGSATGKPTQNFDSIKSLESQVDSLNPIALFVDVHLGLKESGLDILPSLKIKWPFAPIIVITNDRDENAVGDALAAGADDFIYKPINAKELVARLQARLGELAKREAREVIKIGDVTVDTAHRVIANLDGHHRYLSPTEMNLLTCLLDAHGTVVRRDAMKRKCWGQIYVSDNALNRKLHEVRRALKEISQIVTIRTIYGTGFVLEVKEKTAAKKGA